MKHLVRNDISRNFELRGKVACAAHADRRLDDATWRNRMVLLVCLIALAASCALFVGVSHSWFTDSVKNEGNRIQAGTLGIELSTTGDCGVILASDGRWEPGYSEKADATVSNTGSLWLKYAISVDNLQNAGGANLSDVLDVYAVADGATSLEGATLLGNLTDLSTGVAELAAEGVLAPKDYTGSDGSSSKTLNLVVKMRESAGNEYQGASVAFDIVVKATQAAKEQDGFGNDRYDANATLPVTSTADLKTALTQGGSVSLGSDMIIDPEFPADVDPDGAFAQMSVSADTTLDLSDKTIGLDPSVASEELPTTSILIDVRSGTTTLDGDGVVSAEAGYNNSYAIQVNGGSLVINSGSYYGAMSAVQVAKGSCIINGGFFDLAPTIKSAAPSFSSYLINCIDSAYADGTATVEIKGGTFVNFDPSKGPEVGSPSFVADGYKVVSETQSNGEVWYTVVPE